MRATPLVATALALAGCLHFPVDDSSAAEDGTTMMTLVIDAGRLAPANPSGQPWCAAGTLQTSVAVTIAGVRSDTPFADGLEPRWNAALLDAARADISSGVTLEITGRCDAGTRFSIGSLTIRPRRSRIYGGAVVLVGFGDSARVRMHFEASSYSDPGSYDPGGSYDDVPWFDTGDGGWIWIDDGTGETWTDDGSGDSSSDDGGDYWTDDGSGDSSGDGSGDSWGSDDGSGDSGGDSGDDSGDYGVRYPRHLLRRVPAPR